MAEAQTDIALGGGWAGNIKSAGFKGEFTYFQPYQRFDTVGTFSGTVNFDYSFANSIYLVAGYLYGSAGALNANVQSLATQAITAKNLSPYAHSFLVQLSYPVTPLLNTSLATVYSPGDNALFLGPGIAYSIKENWTIDVISQLFLGKDIVNEYDLLGNSLFMRIKFSY